MPTKTFVSLLALVNLTILMNANYIEALPNFNIDVEPQLFQEEASDLEVIQQIEPEDIDSSLISNELEHRYRDKIEETVLEIANDITSNKRILGSTLGSNATVDQKHELHFGWEFLMNFNRKNVFLSSKIYKD